jgi:hypothetical protein
MTAIDRQAPKGTATDERRLDLLRRIAAAGGTIRPNAEPEAQRGYEYLALGDADEKDLSYLAQRDYLDERFFDRVSLCPKCTSHHLNVREICPGCRRAHLANEGLLHHFRCGYVGILSEFTTGKDGSRACPKCNHKLHHLGTEYDRLGKTFVCRECGVISENPPVEAVCLACVEPAEPTHDLPPEDAAYAGYDRQYANTRSSEPPHRELQGILDFLQPREQRGRAVEHANIRADSTDTWIGERQ